MCSNTSLKSLSQLKTKFMWDHHGIGEENYSSPPPPGNFTTNLARQCRAFSRALKFEKLKAPLFRGPEGAGATDDWCIIDHKTSGSEEKDFTIAVS